MSAWTGWIDDFLTGAGLPTSQANRDFLREWATHANTDCSRNPIDLSYNVADSTRCHDLPGANAARNYPSHAAAAGAFQDQLIRGDYPSLFEALNAGNPFSQSASLNIGDDLTKWGSTKFAAFYEEEQLSSPGGTISLPSGMRGLSVLQYALARDVPTALHASKILRRRALRYLHAPRNLR